MTRRTPRRHPRRRPHRKPLEEFLDNVAGMLETVAATAVFSGGAVLLGRMLGTPPPPLELPPVLPPEVKAEWERMMGAPPKPVGKRKRKVEEAVEAGESPRPKPMKLLKGPDGVYRPEPNS
jgi:hypothetical protein